MVAAKATNWNDVKIIYKNGKEMEGMNTHVCDFHWAKKFYKHTNDHVTIKFQDEHINMVHV
jgi:hypothetical protein